MRLPFIDEHSIELATPPEASWHALLRACDRPGASLFARLLGCQDTRVSGPRPLQVGSSAPGFHVSEADPPRRLTLAGRHRFARFEATFHLDPVGSGRTLLRAETRAQFPGLRGRIYRFFVIGTGLHKLATRMILRSVQRASESPL